MVARSAGSLAWAEQWSSKTMFFIFPAYLVLSGLLVFKLWRSRHLSALSNLGLLAILGYCGVWASYFSGFIDYREPVSWTAMAYLTTAMACFVIGNWIGGRFKSAIAPRILPVGKLELVIIAGSILGTMGLVAYVGNFFISGLASMDPHTARLAVLSGFAMGDPTLTKIGHYFGPCGLISTLMAVMARHRLSSPVKLLAYTGFLSGPAYTITMVGRMTIIPVVAAVALMALLFLSRGGQIKLDGWEKLVIPISALLAGVYMLVLPLFRITEQDQVAHTLEVINADPSPSLVWLQGKLSASGASMFVQIVAYTSQQPVMFSRFWDSASLGPYWGLWQFSNIANRVFQQEIRFGDIRDELHQQSSAFDVFGNTWATAVRDTIIDYGAVGGLVQMLIFGFAGGYFRSRFLATGALGAGLLYAFVGGWIVFSFSVSATTLGYYEMFLLGSSILYVVGFGNLAPESRQVAPESQVKPVLHMMRPARVRSGN
jgi:hypothetical protein